MGLSKAGSSATGPGGKQLEKKMALLKKEMTCLIKDKVKEAGLKLSAAQKKQLNDILDKK